MQKVVFNGHYLTYIDSAVADYWREIGLSYPEGYLERYANDVYLRKATVEYHGSARYDDELTVLCRVGRMGTSSMSFHFEIWRDAPAASPSPLISAELMYVNVDVVTATPAPLPEELRERIRAYETRVPAET